MPLPFPEPILFFLLVLFLSSFFFLVFGKIRLWLFLLFCSFLCFFVGMPASAVRAGFMVSLVFLAQLAGRRISSLKALFIAGFLILLFNPLALRYDLGFQLSFCATLGIILFGPVFNYWFKSAIKNNSLREVLVMTLAAQVFVLPILSLNFGYFSLVSLFSNILVFPVLPMIMVLGLLLPLLNFISSSEWRQGFIAPVDVSLILLQSLQNLQLIGLINPTVPFAPSIL